MVGLVVVNSVRRQKALRRELLESTTPRPAIAPGSLERVEPSPGGADFIFPHMHLSVRFLAPDVVTNCWTPGEAPIHYGLAEGRAGPGEGPWPAPSVLVADHDARGWDLVSDAVVVHVANDGATRVALRDGTVLRRSAPPTLRGKTWEQEFEMRPGERFSGLGEQASGVDLRGEKLRLWNTDAGGAWGPGRGPLYIGIPVVVATHGDGNLLTFFENSTLSVFSFGDKGAPKDSAGAWSVVFSGGQLRSYTIIGGPPHLLDRYSELTGRPCLPPRWALGYHQSRWGYKSSTDVREVLHGYASEALPLSALHLDIDYMDGYRVFTVDSSRFGDLPALASEAADRAVRIVTILDPGVKIDRSFDLFREGEALGHFCTDPDGRLAQGVVWPGRSAFPDFTNPRARAWWAEQYERLTGRGVSGIWHDMNEPASIALMGDPTLPLDTRHDFDGRGGDHSEGHNLYGLLMNRSGFDGLSKALPERRPFIVSRSGWAGNQRFAFNWTGDAASTWASMRQQVATLTGLGLSGVPFSGSDIGGFSGVPDEDMYVRWLQMSVFTGFCRTHSVVGAPPREPWRFIDPARRRIGAWIRFRYRLLPYLYTLAHEAAVTGAPLVRPTWWGDTAADRDASSSFGAGVHQEDSDDCFFLGDALLVVPVTQPAASSCKVRMPSGSWSSLWSDDVSNASGGAEGAGALAGGETIRAAAPADRIPVFVRRGTVVPLDDAFVDPSGLCSLEGDPPGGRGPVRLAPDHSPQMLSFHCWPDEHGRAQGVCVDDAGDGHGPSRRDELLLDGATPGSDASLTWVRTGEFPAPSRVRVVLHGLEAGLVVADGSDLGPTESGVFESSSFDSLELRGLRRV